MSQEQPIMPFDWFANQFTEGRRQEFIETIYPHLKEFLKPGDRLVDLACGAGSITVFLAEQGARVTGIDLAPGLIALARQDAVTRGVQADFIQANVLTYPLEEEIYELVVCFGNPITDFPHHKFPDFRERVFAALKPGGFFILEYIDGLERVAFMRASGEVVEQGVDSQIIRRFKGYDPANSAYSMEYHNLSLNKTYLATEYVYVGPLIRLLLEVKFDFVRSIRLAHSFLDVYKKNT